MLINLIEDHHEALTIWRKKGFKNLDLIHIDAHIDFGLPAAKPIRQVFNEAKDIGGLMRGLEQTLAFMHYEKNFDKQINIGNYIYSAVQEGIVKDFYWVIPGGIREFKESLRSIKNMLKSFTKQDPYQQSYRLQPTRYALQGSCYTLKDGMLSTNLFGRKFVICILEKLPIFKNKVLLDIDTDFLVIDSLKNANVSSMLGKRKPWILPDKLADILEEKIKGKTFITIAYSVNGGYTPIKYRRLGDELAYCMASSLPAKQGNDTIIRRNLKAADYFNLFESTGKKEYYQKAISLNSAYRVADNNYGPLYLTLGKLSRAEKEFQRITKVDPANPYPFIGLGNICLRRSDYLKAEKFFECALKKDRDLLEAILGLARAKFNLKEYLQAKKFFQEYQAKEPLRPQSYYFLGRIYEKEEKFNEAIIQYLHAMRLGLNNIDMIHRLLKIALRVKAKDDIVRFIVIRYKEFKERFNRVKKSVIARRPKARFLVRHCQEAKGRGSNLKTGSDQAPQSREIVSLTAFARNDKRKLKELKGIEKKLMLVEKLIKENYASYSR